MQKVGEKLAQWAVEEVNPLDTDAFGRSAFNRFYYASFLITREMLGKFNSEWMNSPHSQIPSLLNGKVKKRIMDVGRVQLKYQTIDKGKLSSVQSSLHALSELLQDAYKVRCDADYCPEKKITRTQIKGELLLEQKTLSSARKWVKQTEMHTKNIQRIGRDLGIF